MIIHPISSEKGMRALQDSNTLVFAVGRKDNREQIKKDVEAQFNVKVIGVRTVINLQGKKKAYVKLSAENPAIEVATKLGLM